MASGPPRYRVIAPDRDASGHHPEAAEARQARSAKQLDEQQQALRGAATPMQRPAAPMLPLPPRNRPPRNRNPAPLPPRPKRRSAAPVAPASSSGAGTAVAATGGATAAAGEAVASILTPEQRQLVDQLRARVADALRDDPGAARLGEESALHRFICARQGSVTDAEEMFRGRLAWHREVDLDKLWSQYRPAEGEAVGAAAAIAEDCFYVREPQLHRQTRTRNTYMRTRCSRTLARSVSLAALALSLLCVSVGCALLVALAPGATWPNRSGVSPNPLPAGTRTAG
eukprot:COSAG06_NODE_1538_length_9150_cov_102.886200_2_plen_285_part_00